MQLIQATIQESENVLREYLQNALDQGQKVLWLMSGGSNIVITADILRQLHGTQNLTLAQVDERYGPVGHPDSNWQQLLDSGAPLDGVTLVPILHNPLDSMHQAAADYEAKLQKLLKTADISIAQLGMGTDGHIAGILPGTESVQAAGLVTSYQTEQFDRITLTFNGLDQVQELWLFAYGQDKKPRLEALQNQDLSLSEQPAQYLKRHPRVVVYNDSIEGNNV